MHAHSCQVIVRPDRRSSFHRAFGRLDDLSGHAPYLARRPRCRSRSDRGTLALKHRSTRQHRCARDERQGSLDPMIIPVRDLVESLRSISLFASRPSRRGVLNPGEDRDATMVCTMFRIGCWLTPLTLDEKSTTSAIIVGTKTRWPSFVFRHHQHLAYPIGRIRGDSLELLSSDGRDAVDPRADNHHLGTPSTGAEPRPTGALGCPPPPPPPGGGG